MSKASVVRADGPSQSHVGGLDGLALLGRFLLVGGGCGGVIGAVAGLVIGLAVYAPTAPFAVVELGVPAAITGSVVGAVAGAIVIAWRRIRPGCSEDAKAKAPRQ